MVESPGGQRTSLGFGGVGACIAEEHMVGRIAVVEKNIAAAAAGDYMLGIVVWKIACMAMETVLCWTLVLLPWLMLRRA